MFVGLTRWKKCSVQQKIMFQTLAVDENLNFGLMSIAMLLVMSMAMVTRKFQEIFCRLFTAGQLEFAKISLRINFASLAECY